MDSYISSAKTTVAVFDSGIGGLNLLKECIIRMPSVNFLYVADNYAVPYGGRGEEDILNRVNAKFKIINDIGVDAAVVACNTATAVCIDFLRKTYPFPIIGIQPAVKQAALSGGRCAVLCTPTTAKSRSLRLLVERYGLGKTQIVPCPDLAAYVERRAPHTEEEEVIKMLPDICADCVVLGCTHYAYIKNAIQNRYGVPIFDGMVGTADHLKTLLGNCNHFSKNLAKTHFIGGNITRNYEIFKHLMKNVFY